MLNTERERESQSSMVLDPADAFVNRVRLHSATLTAHQEVFQHKGRVPDHSWHEFDAQGHFHGWSDNGVLPTLRTEWHLRDCADRCSGECAEDLSEADDFGMTECRHACQLCGERVVPGMKQGTSFDRGRLWHTVQVVGGGELVNLGGAQVTFVHPGGFGTGTLEVHEVTYYGGHCAASATVRLSKWWPRRTSGGAL
jgi:hypothetical protein